MNDIIKCTNLQILNSYNNQLSWKLSDLSLLALLSELQCINNNNSIGNIKDLLLPPIRKFITIDLSSCTKITGNLMDVSKLLTLQGFGYSRTSIIGDIRDINIKHDFVLLQLLLLENESKYEGNMAVTGQVRSGTCKSDKPEDMGHIGPKNHHNKMNCGTKYDSQKPTVLGSAVKKVG